MGAPGWGQALVLALPYTAPLTRVTLQPSLCLRAKYLRTLGSEVLSWRRGQ